MVQTGNDGNRRGGEPRAVPQHKGQFCFSFFLAVGSPGAEAAAAGREWTLGSRKLSQTWGQLLGFALLLLKGWLSRPELLL